MNKADLISGMVSLLPATTAGLIGVIMGSFSTSLLAGRRERRQRRYAFRERQLRELYSPLVGLRREIATLSHLQTKIYSISDDEWKRLCAESRESVDAISSYERLKATHWPYFEKSIDFNNQQWARAIMPAYRKMVALLRDNFWLAEPETRRYTDKLVEFVDVWERWLAKAIPYEVVNRLGHSESSLHPLYEHIEKTHDEIRTLIKTGNA